MKQLVLLLTLLLALSNALWYRAYKNVPIPAAITVTKEVTVACDVKKAINEDFANWKKQRDEQFKAQQVQKGRK